MITWFVSKQFKLSNPQLNYWNLSNKILYCYKNTVNHYLLLVIDINATLKYIFTSVFIDISSIKHHKLSLGVFFFIFYGKIPNYVTYLTLLNFYIKLLDLKIELAYYYVSIYSQRKKMHYLKIKCQFINQNTTFFVVLFLLNYFNNWILQSLKVPFTHN